VQSKVDLGGAEAYGLAITEDAVWAVPYRAATLVKVDPGSMKVVSTLPLAAQPASLLSAAGSLWVAGYGGHLYRVDAATGKVTADVPTAGEVCCDLSFGGGFVWALDPSGFLLGVDPATAAIVRRYPVPINRNAHSNVVYAGDSVWVASDGAPMQRIEPKTGKAAQVDVGGGVPFLVQGGRLWGADPGAVWALDPATGKVAQRIALANSTEVMALAIDGTTLWAGIRRPGRVGAVLRIDLASGNVLGELRDITIPARIEVGHGSVWVTDSGSNLLYRLARGTP
jgi:streptogramin lyase